MIGLAIDSGMCCKICLPVHYNLTDLMLALYPGPSRLFKAEGPGCRNHMTLMHGWTRDLNSTNLTFENSCLVSTSSTSRLSDGRLLEHVGALYMEL